jgi:Na+-transporting methylmalonyl-CoA/oxaloacetate decarboxylase gamma subunit
MFSLALQLMLYGLAGVFAALAVLYTAVRAVSKIFPHNNNDNNTENEK